MRRAKILLSTTAVLIATIVIAVSSVILWPCPLPKQGQTIAVIVGYDYFFTDRPPLTEYVGKIVPYLRQQPGLRTIIVSGGHTRPHDSPLSEAELLKAELERQGVTTPIILEDCAFTTEQNVIYSSRKLADEGLAADQIIIFSDWFKEPAVKGFVEANMHNYKVCTCGIPLIGPQLRRRWEKMTGKH